MSDVLMKRLEILVDNDDDGAFTLEVNSKDANDCGYSGTRRGNVAKKMFDGLARRVTNAKIGQLISVNVDGGQILPAQ
jgi:hypothetical protein